MKPDHRSVRSIHIMLHIVNGVLISDIESARLRSADQPVERQIVKKNLLKMSTFG